MKRIEREKILGNPSEEKIGTGEENNLSFDEASLQFIEEVGTLFERNGVARAAGRILGLLLLAKRPLSQEEMATVLQTSRASVSTNIQLGEVLQLIRIVPRQKGVRRDYYEISPGSWERAFMNAEGQVRVMQNLANNGLRIISSDNKAAQKRLKEMLALYDLYMEWWNNFEKAWEKRKAELALED